MIMGLMRLNDLTGLNRIGLKILNREKSQSLESR